MSKKVRKMKLKYKRGMSLAEILVAVFIFMVVLGTLIAINNLYLLSSSQNIKSVKAAYLAEEGIEAVRVIRDNNWTNISFSTVGVPYYINFDSASSTWKATTTPNSIESYIRWFVLSQVERDSNGKIVSNGGIVDPDIKLVTVSVFWQDRGSTTTKSISTYISNIISD